MIGRSTTIASPSVDASHLHPSASQTQQKKSTVTRNYLSCAHCCVYWNVKSQFARVAYIMDFYAKVDELACQVFVKYPNGKTSLIQNKSSSVIQQLKFQIYESEGIPEFEQCLVFRGKQLEDDKTFEEQCVGKNATIFLLFRLNGGGFYQLPSGDYREPSKDYDYTDKKDDGQKFMRAGHVYHRPFGYKRFALKVSGRYNSDDWLGEDGIRAWSSNGEWPISYHGTTKEKGESIARNGFDDSKIIRQAYGRGHYSSPYTAVAEQYATAFTYDGERYIMLIQSRCNPKGTRFDCDGDKIWLTSSSYDIRPYNVCVRKL